MAGPRLYKSVSVRLPTIPNWPFFVSSSKLAPCTVFGSRKPAPFAHGALRCPISRSFFLRLLVAFSWELCMCGALSLPTLCNVHFGGIRFSASPTSPLPWLRCSSLSRAFVVWSLRTAFLVSWLQVWRVQFVTPAMLPACPAWLCSCLSPPLESQLFGQKTLLSLLEFLLHRFSLICLCGAPVTLSCWDRCCTAGYSFHSHCS